MTTPDAAAAAIIAAKHLPDGTEEQRVALAKDVLTAIFACAQAVAIEALVSAGGSVTGAVAKLTNRKSLQ